MRLFLIPIVLLGVTAFAVGQTPVSGAAAGQYLGFDRNDYPGDGALPEMRKHFAFVGYWLTNPPGARSNSWRGKREVLRRQGFGFLVLANGKEDAEILKARKALGKTAEAIGQRDAAAAIGAAQREHFPAGTILFLDQEEGGRLLPEQADYLLGWTEAVAQSSYKPGAYLSGQPVGDGPGKTVTTAQDVQARVAAGHLHRIALWVYQDACPPSNGCTLRPPALSASGTPEAVAWQYAQSPQRIDNTRACAKTYANGNCNVPDIAGMSVDLDVASSADPSQGR